jgi:hypothetical protein
MMTKQVWNLCDSYNVGDSHKSNICHVSHTFHGPSSIKQWQVNVKTAYV